MWFDVYRDANRQYRWRLIAGNSKKIANSGEGYPNLADCEHAIWLVAWSGECLVHYGQASAGSAAPFRTLRRNAAS